MNSLGLNVSSRACAPLWASNNANCWLVGTTALRASNEVVQVESSEEGDPVRVTATYSHPAEVWAIDTSPEDRSLFATVFSQGGKSGAALWKAQPLANKATQLCDLSAAHSTRVRQVLWHPRDASLMLTVEDAGARLWQLRGAAAEASGSMLAGQVQEMLCGAWDPHSPRLCTAEGGNIQVWDLRQRQPERLVQCAHSLPVRHLDFAKQRPDVLASCGDDGRIRVWDLRTGSTAAPLIDLPAANHWVWKLAFNPQYDNLLIAGSSDTTCALWHLNLSAASAQLARPSPAATAAGAKPGGVAAAGPPKAGGASSPAAAAIAVRAGAKPVAASGKLPPTDRLQQYTGHQSSVYQVAWSAVDPWTYASLSFDGQLALHLVPNSIKYKLLI